MFTEEKVEYKLSKNYTDSEKFFCSPCPGMAIIFAKYAVDLFFTLKITEEGHQLNYSSHMELSRSRLVVKVEILMGVFSRSLCFIILIYEVYSEYPV